VTAVPSRVAIVGAGVSGLAAAHRLLRTEPSLDVTVLEAERRAGGRLSAVRVGELELESGPDSFVARKPWAAELCRELGLALVEPGASGAFVWTDRGLVRMPASALGVPSSAGDLARWPGLSRRGRLRALADLVRKASPPHEEDESLGTLLRRRLGDEATDGLVAPLLAGLFAGDVDRMSVRATFPELERWERAFGSLIRGAKASLEAAHDAGPMFLKPAGGVPRLPEALVEAIGPERVRVGDRAEGLRRDGGAFVLRTPAGEVPADAVVLATPAFAAAEIVASVDGGAAASLREIPFASTGVVLLVYPEGTAHALPDATGFVVPRGGAPMTAATFLSRKWPDASYGDRAVVRCFVGAVGFEDVLDAPDKDIVEAVCRHLAAALPLPERASASRVVRWPSSMPQFDVGHLERVAAVESALPPGIFVCGNAYRGVGVADAVRSAGLAAENVKAYLVVRGGSWSWREHANDTRRRGGSERVG
jgi:protoporphyrinogen/coproporphyrinogen III oxidase